MKKGLTLVELIAVIVLLGIIGLIAIPIINNTLKEQRDTLYESQISEIKTASERWVFDNPLEAPTNEGETKEITIGDLQAGGYLNELIDSRTGDEISEYLKITITKRGEGYYYEIEN